MILAALVGCTTPADPDLPSGSLGVTARLLRASMALRGIRPSLDELRGVEADPRLFETYVDRYLDDPRFGETVREIHEQAWLMESDVLQIPASGSLASFPMGRIRASLSSGPSRLAERVVTDGRPYTEIVTADWFVADAVVAAAWPDVVGFDADRPDEWQVVTWGDGRPAAGVLMDSGLWMRYRSPNSNFNRQRANALSRALLCQDFLERQTEAEALVDLTDVQAAIDAVSTEPGCVGCHQDLDPLAGFLPFDPFWAVPSMRFPYPVYDDAWETAWKDMTGRPPGYFGLGGGDLAELGRYVAADPRFAACAARRFYGAFAQMEPSDVPIDVAAPLQDVLVSTGFDAEALARAAILHPSLSDGHRRLWATPRQLARTVEDLTGFRWTASIDAPCCGATAGSSPYGEIALGVDQYHGYDVVAGGFDGDATPSPARAATVPSAAFRRRLAEQAAQAVVDRDLAGGGELLTGVGADTTDEATVRDQIVRLELRLYGERHLPDSPEVDRTFALWTDTASRTTDPARAWKVVLTAMLQDLRLATY